MTAMLEKVNQRLAKHDAECDQAHTKYLKTMEAATEQTSLALKIDVDFHVSGTSQNMTLVLPPCPENQNKKQEMATLMERLTLTGALSTETATVVRNLQYKRSLSFHKSFTDENNDDKHTIKDNLIKMTSSLAETTDTLLKIEVKRAAECSKIRSSIADRRDMLLQAIADMTNKKGSVCKILLGECKDHISDETKMLCGMKIQKCQVGQCARLPSTVEGK
tara:strand:- start:47 stop:706 length:660 start_codon:yes stop_codon:yes gene_type:complete